MTTKTTTKTDYFDKFLKEKISAQDMRWDICSLKGKLSYTHPELVKELDAILSKHDQRTAEFNQVG